MYLRSRRSGEPDPQICASTHEVATSTESVRKFSGSFFNIRTEERPPRLGLINCVGFIFWGDVPGYWSGWAFGPETCDASKRPHLRFRPNGPFVPIARAIGPGSRAQTGIKRPNGPKIRIQPKHAIKFADSTGFYVFPVFRTRTANKREWTRMQYSKFAFIRVHSRFKNTAHRIG